MPPRRFFNNRMNEVIDFICFHQLNALALIEFTHAIQEHFHELFLGQPLIRAHWSDVLSLFPSEAHEAILAMIALHGDLQEERIGHLWCCDVMECMESTPNAFSMVTRKCSNASAMRVISSTLYNSWYSPHVFISKVFHSFTMYPHQLISPGRLARCQTQNQYRALRTR